MPLPLTIFIARAASRLSRWFGRGGGSALPGLIAERLDPDSLHKLAGHLPKVVVITGTNGKTTATKMLVEILRQEGRQVLSNESGSNLTRGLLSSLVNQASLSGNLPAETGVFEVDEATMPAACAALRPDLVVVMNLFRDQLDRYGELDTTAAMVGRGLSQLNLGATIILNADDPLVASLSKYAPAGVEVMYFGVEDSKLERLPHDFAADSTSCPNDGHSLIYSKNFFGHMGHYDCPEGDFGRPVPSFALIEAGSGTKVKQALAGNQAEPNEVALRLPLPGLYNAYNALAVLGAALSLGISIKTASRALERVTAAFGRVERVQYRGRQLCLLLIKNPTGFNQVIQTFFSAAAALPNIMIAINDNFADGRDVSWLWDVGFEELKVRQPVIASGIRATDLAVRLKYAEIKTKVAPDLQRAVDELLTGIPEGETAYILPTYTAMLELRRVLGLKRFSA
jgi:lipid II isoglutaminyl synthase (glutamine-hydrolysing)